VKNQASIQKGSSLVSKTRNIMQQEEIHTYAIVEAYINISINAERQQFPHPQLLTPEDDHFGRNMK
jgi:hypothetical protein